MLGSGTTFVSCSFSDIDYVTPLLTQLVYEGRLDDHFEIQLGTYECLNYSTSMTIYEGFSCVVLSSSLSKLLA